MNKKKVLAISFSAPGKDARLLGIINTLNKKDFEITVIALDDKSFANIAKANKYKYIPIYVCPITRMIKKWQSFYKMGKEYTKKLKPDIVIASDFYALPLASKFKNRKNQLIYDSREIYSALGSLANYPIKQFIHTIIEKFYIRRVDDIVVSGDLDAEYLKKHFKHSTPYHTIMNVPPYKKIVDSSYIRDKYSIPFDKTIILYQGALMEGRGIYKLIELVSKNNDYALFIIGDGPERNKINDMILRTNLFRKIILSDAVPYDELHNITCSADISTALFEDISLSYKLALPNKLFESMMAGVPVIASDLPAIRRIYDKHPFGALISSDCSIEELDSKISEIISNKNNYAKILTNASKIYNYEAQATKIYKLVKHN
jgi:glycosyltransferase involved in cell wall biosynthesis